MLMVELSLMDSNNHKLSECGGFLLNIEEVIMQNGVVS